MALGTDNIKQELIELAAKLARERLGETRSEPAERFLRAFYAHVPWNALAEETPDYLYGAALSLWKFAQQRNAKQSKIRVFNPRHDSHGWKSAHTVVEIVCDDMPFLVDSVIAGVQSLHSVTYLSEVQSLIHPVVCVQRDGDGQLVALLDASPSKTESHGDAPPSLRESCIQLQVSEQPEDEHGALAAKLSDVLADVRMAVEDWQPMLERCRALTQELRETPPPLPEESLEEGLAFLEWMTDDHFTLLGYREYIFEGQGADAVAQVRPGSGLGLLRDDEFTIFAENRSLAPMPEHVRSFLRRPELLVISKAARRSTVHRAVQLDAIGVKELDAEGEVVGQRLFVGLYGSTAYTTPPTEIPILRRKVAHTVQQADLPLGGHDHKALLHILNSYPRDELFHTPDETLFDIAMGILHLQTRQRVAVFPRLDAFERYVSCLVFVPRDRFDTALRLKFQEILSAAYEGEVSDYYTHLTDSNLARVQFIIQTQPGAIPLVDLTALEQRLVDASRSWRDHLQEALVEHRGEVQGMATLHRFGDAFPAAYQHHFSALTAVSDLVQVEQAMQEGLALNLFRPLEAAPNELRLKVYGAAERVPLADILPMLENMGLKVVDEIPYELKPEGATTPVWIRDFHLSLEADDTMDLAHLRGIFHEAFRQVWRGEMEDDGFNRLVLQTGANARQVTILRALCKYLLQARIPFSQTYMEDTLASNPDISRLLVRLFLSRFDPSETQAGDDEADLSEAIETLLESVSHLDEDRIIRRFKNCIESTLRTNFFQTDGDGRPKPYLSFKFDCARLDALPKPRPHREIFVYSPRMEAVHLRSGPVARGGIRWSDRREDFRTEILGLVKAQQVKNAVIVPVGSKGGFVIKGPLPEDRAQRYQEGVACYTTMMQGMLDVTDNLVDGTVVPPPSVRLHDGDDPYLVVAADKGTATFSDIANGISESYDFWLGDGFASGGSAGYDHKKMGITARGAWESVKRHFREMDKDIQEEAFTVVGVGDMSGDVFGNGMLLSRHIRLVAAFNHLHIFVDPDPDVATGWQERQRLFQLERSTWEDYNSDLISAGGGVFSRSDKSIAVSPQMAEVLEIEGERVTPTELIQHILRAHVELLWFGGIGTYIKAGQETDAMVGDPANDALRIDASEIRAEVIGEGANLGMTQRARIELAQLGGRLNTDAIDNSAGVDCSDHEVNIKILLREIETAGDLTRKQRNELLVDMTDEVAELVLRDNYLQTQAITVTQRLGARLLDRTGRFIRGLERSGRLDRRLEFLPDDEALTERIQKGIGFTRPELSVLLSYAKMELYDALLDSDLPEEPYLHRELARYFPKALQERFPEAIQAHRLRREIIATVVTNDTINRVGITFLREVKERTGMAAADIARAYMISREIFDMRPLWRRIEGLDNQLPAAVQASLLANCGRLLERSTVWFLREEARDLGIDRQVERYRDGVLIITEQLRELVSETAHKDLEQVSADLQRQGADETTARLAASVQRLSPACDIVRIALDTEVPVPQVGRLYFAIGDRLGFDWLRRAAGRLPTESAWDKLAITAIVDDLYNHQSDLTRRMVVSAESSKDVGARLIDAWAENYRPQVMQTEQLLAELQSVNRPNLSMLAVANRQLKSMSH